MHIHLAVDADRLASHEVAVVRGEKNDGAYQVLRVFDRRYRIVMLPICRFSKSPVVFCISDSSMHIHSAVDADRLASHEVAVVRGEKNNGAYQILRVLVPLN